MKEYSYIVPLSITNEALQKGKVILFFEKKYIKFNKYVRLNLHRSRYLALIFIKFHSRNIVC